jgi:hypothetical protein
MAKHKSPLQLQLRFVSLLCVLLITFAGFAQAIHVHSDNSELQGHACSVCSVAHAGVLGATVYQATALLFLTIFAPVSPAASKSAGFVSSPRIRPPPVA